MDWSDLAVSWTILNEVGIDYAGVPATDQSLSFPVVLERASDGSFLIVDEDPRGNIEMLLDTKPHVVFAIR